MLTKTDQQNIETLVRTVVKDEVKHLPTKSHFDERMDKLTKEIQDARDELAAHAMSHEKKRSASHSS